MIYLLLLLVQMLICTNKLSLNTDKTKYVLFHKKKSKEKKNLPLVLTTYLLMMLKSNEKTH